MQRSTLIAALQCVALALAPAMRSALLRCDDIAWMRR